MTHKTKGIVLRTIKYGETSVISTVYTELFGLQSYIVKGIRQQTKKSSGKANYFLAGALLDMVVYNNELKNLQFVKEFNWSHIYETVFFDVTKNAVSVYMIELLLNSIKQSEHNPDLFFFIENSFLELDKSETTVTANLPLFFALKLGTALGFKMDGIFSEKNQVLDVLNGSFINYRPNHFHFVEGEPAEYISIINSMNNFFELKNLQLNKNIRRDLLSVLQLYFTLHIADFGELKSVKVLQEVLS